MFANSKRSDEAQDDKDAFSLRDRLKAWWEGYELLETPAAQPTEAEHDGEPEAPRVLHYEPPKQRWETSRVTLVQKVWGEGFATPGGHNHILDMIKILGLDPALTVLDLGAHLGGAGRVMSGKFGVWVTGFEADPALVEAGMGLSVKAGMGEKAPVLAFDPGTFEHKQSSVDCVFSKEFLFTVADKRKFLKAVEDLLKPKGQLLFTDFVLAKPNLRSPTLENWIENEPERPYPWAIEDYEEAFGGLRIDIRVAEDITKAFRAMVIKGWGPTTPSRPVRGASTGARSRRWSTRSSSGPAASRPSTAAISRSAGSTPSRGTPA
jgi:SAM-dependent methyltransferase